MEMNQFIFLFLNESSTDTGQKHKSATIWVKLSCLCDIIFTFVQYAYDKYILKSYGVV